MIFGTQNGIPLLDRGAPQGDRQMGFADPGGTQKQYSIAS